MKHRFSDRFLYGILLCILTAVCFCAYGMRGACADTVTIPSDCKAIEEEAFFGDTGLGEAVLPDGIETIGSRAFAQSGLKRINLPESLVFIADDALDAGVEVVAKAGSPAYCWAVEHGFTPVPEESPVSWFDFKDNADGTTCTLTGRSGMPAGTADIVIPRQNAGGKTVTAIGSAVFSGYYYLKSVYIPDTVTSIGMQAFKSCTRLTSVTLPDSVTSVGEYAFQYCRSVAYLKISNGMTRIGDYAFKDMEGLKTVRIPTGVREIGRDAFAGCKSMTGILIPNSVSDIGAYAFKNCSSLVSVTLPEDLPAISDQMFCNCTGLRQMMIPSGVTCIGNEAFRGCTGLEYVSIPTSVTVTGRGVFRECTRLQSIVIPSSLTAIDQSMFEDCTALCDVSLPDSINYIGPYAFHGCTGLQKIILPPIANLLYYVFYDCTALTTVAFRGTYLASFDLDAFKNCENIQTVYCPYAEGFDTVWERMTSYFGDKVTAWDGSSDI